MKNYKFGAFEGAVFLGNKHIMKKTVFIVLILGYILSGCAGGRYSVSKENLLSETYATSNSGLKIKIPSGWIQAFDNDNNILDLWLVSGDYSASLKFKAINFDVPGNMLDDAFQISIAGFRAILGNSVTFNEESIINNRTKTYGIFKNGNLIKRVIVYEVGGMFYECIADFTKEFQNSRKTNIIEIQNKVITELINRLERSNK